MIEAGKRYETEQGYPVTILTTNRKNDDGYCVVGLVKFSEVQENVETWKIDGTREKSGCNLVPAPVKLDEAYEEGKHDGYEAAKDE